MLESMILVQPARDSCTMVTIWIYIVFGFLFLTHTIVGIIFLNKFYDYHDGCQNLWKYCVVATAFSFIMALITWFKALYIFDGISLKYTYVPYFLIVMTMAMITWSIIIYTDINYECINFFQTNANELYIFFGWTSGCFIGILFIGVLTIIALGFGACIGNMMTD